MSEPKKVYIITKGVYSDYHICAVTLDKNIAEKLCRAYTDNDRHKAWIEEYDLNERLEDVRIMYCVEITDDDVEVCVDDDDNKEYEFGDRGDFTAYVLARDQEHAVKIAQDRRAEYLAKKNGVV